MDLSFLRPIAEAFKAHAYGTVAFLMLCALLNVAFWLKSPADWVKTLDGYPRVHAAMDVIRAFVQPVELLGALARLVSGQWPTSAQPPSLTGGRGSESPFSPSARMRSIVDVPFLLPIALLTLICVLLASMLPACSVFTPKRVHGVEQVIQCVLANRHQTPEAIAEVCAVADAQSVVDIIVGEDKRAVAAQQAAVKR